MGTTRAGATVLAAMNRWLGEHHHPLWIEWPSDLHAAWTQLLGDRLGLPWADGRPALVLTNRGPEFWGPDGRFHRGEWPPTVRGWLEDHPEQLLPDP